MISRNFNPRPSYEERRKVMTAINKDVISIHAPHTRSDARPSSIESRKVISIHAPHTRSDGDATREEMSFGHFNPRPSYEERRVLRFCCSPRILFQSTPLIRGATNSSLLVLVITRKFQSTPLIRGATITSSTNGRKLRLFQSTPLIRGATFAVNPF